jgi:hypothetical protein
MVVFARRLLIFTAATVLAACSRAPEVTVLSRTISPDGTYIAEVSEVVYGPHFGGESPAIEVWVAHGGQSERVLQLPEEGNEVVPHWIGSDQLVLHFKGNDVATDFKASSLGASIKLVKT